MAEIKYPYFTRHRILKIGMLENLRDFPRDALECFSADLSDGIICGLVPIIEKDTITFSNGIVKYKGDLHSISNLAPISYKETDAEVYIKIIFKNEEQTPDYKTQFIDFAIYKDSSSRENEIELGRFKLKKGAYLRSNYQDLYDFTTEYNTINIVNVLYSGYGQPTLSNLILKYFAKSAVALNPQNSSDIYFCMLCLNSQRIERDVISHYLKNRLMDWDMPSRLCNLEMHLRLVKALEIIKKEAGPKKQAQDEKRKIILD